MPCFAAAGYNFGSLPALAGQAFARPHPGSVRAAAKRPTGLKTAAQPFFTDD
jgi:hypothetical protein